ncbi:sporulation integral membrane protein YlbJ [Desulfurispora thermophila]|uniref:sporulation integral membrane protein YlbJ n=1 Tax=Desulfurispora thermophila TaxID=265470 RepID=UPI000365F967|nr:sporulation integral membrane protein YlbJ [Desulfurispora thermophila]
MRPIATPLLIIFILLALVTYPALSFQGAQNGVKLWLNVVFPALLPFFIASELLMNSGLVHFFSILLEPLMRPLFRLPGSASLVLCAGYTSGYPIAAVMIARLRRDGLCTPGEAARLLSFSSNASPLFMLTAVAVGMLGNQQLGLYIAASHYLANLTIGLLLRFFNAPPRTGFASPFHTGVLLQRAWREYLLIQSRDNRPVGKILADAVRQSVNNLLAIGGYVVFFAVLINLFKELQIIHHTAALLAQTLTPLGLPAEITPALAAGLWEMTVGCQQATMAPAELLTKLQAISIILAWSGISVLTQTAAMLAGSGVSLRLFLLMRPVHAALACLYITIFYKHFSPVQPAVVLNTPAFDLSTPTLAWLYCLKMILLLPGGIIIMTAITSIIKRLVLK